MIRYSYMIIDQLASFGGDDDIRRTLEFIKDCYCMVPLVTFAWRLQVVGGPLCEDQRAERMWNDLTARL